MGSSTINVIDVSGYNLTLDESAKYFCDSIDKDVVPCDKLVPFTKAYLLTGLLVPDLLAQPHLILNDEDEILFHPDTIIELTSKRYIKHINRLL